MKKEGVDIMLKKIEAQITKYENQRNKAVEATDNKISKLKAQIEQLEAERKIVVEPLDVKIKQLQLLKKKAEQIENDFSSAINNQ